MVIIIEILVVLYSLYCLSISIKHINNNSINVIHAFFFVTCVFPLILDYVIGVPIYKNTYPLFNISQNHIPTRILYCLFLFLTQLIMLYFGRKQKREDTNSGLRVYDYRWVRIILWISIILPIILVFLFKIDTRILYSFNWRYDGFDTSVWNGYGSIERLTYIGVMASIIMLINNKYFFYRCLATIFLVSNICIEGKRSILFFALVAFVVCIIYRYKETKKSSNNLLLVLLVILGFLIIIFVSYQVQTKYRGYSSFSDIYRSSRIDYFRDDVIKASIYAMLDPNIKILNYPFQSIIMELGYLFPLIWLGIPKIGYETYMTSALRFISIEYLNDVRMTVSVHDSMIANFGIFGFILSGVIALIFANIADKQNSNLKPIIICGYILISMYSLSYVIWYFQFWSICIFLLNVFAKRKMLRGQTNESFNTFI